MKLIYDHLKEQKNNRQHKLSLEIGEYILDDPLVLIVYDRFEEGENRYHAIGMVGHKCLVLVHAYPDPDDENLIRAISLREATRDERRRYEEGEIG